MQNIEVHCCLCKDPCNTSNDLKNHLRNKHCLKEAALAKYVKQSMDDEFNQFVNQEIAECLQSLLTKKMDECSESRTQRYNVFEEMRKHMQNMDIPLTVLNAFKKEFEERTGNTLITQKSNGPTIHSFIQSIFYSCISRNNNNHRVRKSVKTYLCPIDPTCTVTAAAAAAGHLIQVHNITDKDLQDATIEQYNMTISVLTSHIDEINE